eukprot:scaffold36436_cov75-Phaeocystis_antarctica.AAC.3
MAASATRQRAAPCSASRAALITPVGPPRWESSPLGRHDGQDAGHSCREQPLAGDQRGWPSLRLGRTLRQRAAQPAPTVGIHSISPPQQLAHLQALAWSGVRGCR